MTRRILINGRRAEELRVAIVDNQTLEDFEIETKRSGLLRNNIYRGVVANIAPSLNAAFVDFGDSKNGFLAFNDVVESVYCKNVPNASRIADVLTIGQTLIVQVIKDATGLKGAQVTTNISLAGRYLVLRPKDAKSGVSRKVDDDARADLTQKVRSLDLPEGYGCIVRTNAMDQSRAILLRDAKVLVQLWHKIEAEFGRGKGPALLYNDQDIVVQAMRDYFDSTINEVLIDDKSCYERATAYVRATIASGEEKLKLYEDKMPLFTRFGIEKQIDQIYARQVQLPSGGFIVIDPTEALTAIDVNSAHSTKRETQDLTAYHTNLEAAVEIGRQLRMRDIGGLIVIDFIDMRSGKHQRDVERVMRNAMARDKARNKVERISANGLLEINRQRISQTLAQRTHLVCPTCGGRGFIPSADAIGLNLIREIDARAVNGELGGVIIKLHPDIAEQVQNVRRRDFAQLENEYDIRIEIVASKDMSRGDESIEWLTKRQENALHPEIITQNAATDAASIIDVAEAYQAQDGDADSYRPNDFEEYSSEDARKRRAAKRAGRKEQAAETPADTEQVKKVERVKAEVESAENVVSRKSQEPTPVRRYYAGLIALSALVEFAASAIFEKGATAQSFKRPRRRFTFKSHHRAGKPAETGIQMDVRLFATDILRAAIALGFVDKEEAQKQSLADRARSVAAALASFSGDVSAEERATSLLESLNSRYAFARVSALLNIGDSQPDELAQLLIAECQAVFGDSDKRTPKKENALRSAIASRLGQVFNITDNADTAHDEVEAASESVAETVSAAQEKTIETVPEEVSEPNPAEVGSMLAQDEDVSRRRHRSARRRQAIGEIPSPFIGDNEAVITSDVPIAPITFIHDEDPSLPSDENLRKIREEQIAQEITQELPAVSMRSGRRARRSRSDKPVAAIDPFTDSQPLMPADIISATLPEMTKFNESVDVELPVFGEDAGTPVSDKRRVRKTHRDRIGEAETAKSVAAESAPAVAPQNDAVKPVESVPAPVAQTERVRPARNRRDRAPIAAASEPSPVSSVDEVSSAKSDSKNAPVDVSAETPVVKQGERRVRHTKRVDVQQPLSPIAEAISQSEPVTVENAPADVPVQQEENRSTRRVRHARSRAAGVNHDVVAETQIQPVAQEPVAVESPVEVEPESAVQADDSGITNARSHRTRRRTRRFNMAETQDAEMPDTERVQVEPMPNEAPDMVPAPESADTHEPVQRRSRVRHTRRASLDEE